jgi:hypothetical protein
LTTFSFCLAYPRRYPDTPTQNRDYRYPPPRFVSSAKKSLPAYRHMVNCLALFRATLVLSNATSIWPTLPRYDHRSSLIRPVSLARHPLPCPRTVLTTFFFLDGCFGTGVDLDILMTSCFNRISSVIRSLLSKFLVSLNRQIYHTNDSCRLRFLNRFKSRSQPPPLLMLNFSSITLGPRTFK